VGIVSAVLVSDHPMSVRFLRTRRGGAAWLPAAALLVVSAVAILLAGFGPTGAGGQYALVAPPWFDLGRTMQLADAAGGEIVDVGGLTNVVIVHSGDPQAVRALYAAGAWLVLDPGRLRGCLDFAPLAAAATGAS
jgi:hypothetical protein